MQEILNLVRTVILIPLCIKLIQYYLYRKLILIKVLLHIKISNFKIENEFRNRNYHLIINLSKIHNNPFMINIILH